MERSVLCQAFVLGCGFFLLSDAAISLNFIENSGTNLECGTSVVLMCEIQPYGNSLTWKVDGVIAAQCGSTSASCISNPAFSRYTFSYDISSGTFNLTIATVGLSDDGIDFTCEDGTNFVTKSASTIVPFDANSCSVTPTVGSSSVTVEATTSCVYPASEVEIQWYYFESIGGPENEMTESDFSYTSSKNEDNSSCTSGACTSGNGVTTVVENAVFDIQSTGTEVYIQARFVQFSKSELKNTTKKYKIKKAGPDPYKCPGLGEHKATDTKAKCVCAWLGIFCAILLCLFIIGIIVEYNKEIWDDDEIPFFLWILLFIIIVGFGILALAKIRNRVNGDVEPGVDNSRHETERGNQRTGQKKPVAKKNKSKDSAAQIENEQHNQGKTRREQPPPPHGAGPATGTTLNGREDSDGEVSREHVDLQVSGHTLPQSSRPIPDIPRGNGQQGDNDKGRHSSATISGEKHPLTNIVTPSQKAGILESLPEGKREEQVKKLKKKKLQEDEM